MHYIKLIGRPWLSACLSLGLVMALAGGVSAHEEGEEEGEGPNRGRLSLTFNNDFTTAYFFRGVLNERDGFIWQPSIDLGLNVYEGEGALTSVDLGIGVWNSIHTEETLADGSGPEGIYETDYYPSIAFTLGNVLETVITYYWYTSPNGAFNTVEEAEISLAYDDSELLGPFAFYPTATFAFEVHNTSFGDDEGGVFEFGGTPGVEVPLAENYPLSIDFPFMLGLSMYDYYEDDSGDDTFGYFSQGLDAGIPLAFIPEDYGAWSFTLGVDVFFFGDNLEDANEGDSPYAVWTASLTLDY